MKKLLSILGSVGMIGTAGATVVACGNKSKESAKENPIEVAKKLLEAKITEAEGLISTSKKEDNVTEALRIATNEAKDTLNKKGVTETELTKATNDLSAAISKFTEAEDKEVIAAKKLLQVQISTAEELLENSRKEESTNKALKSAIKEAKKVSEEKNVNKEVVENATIQLQQAIQKFRDAADIKNPREKLEEKINEANRLIVLGSEAKEKRDEAIKILKDAVATAKQVIEKPEVNDDELIKALNKLQEAINTYNDSPDGIGVLLHKLEMKIIHAETIKATAILGGSKTPEEIEAFTKIINKAKNIHKNPKNEAEIEAITKELTEATYDFENS